MTQMIERGRTVAAPAVTPLPGTLLDVAHVTDGVSWLEPSDLYETFSCIPTNSETEFPCPPQYLAVPVVTVTAAAGGTLTASTTYLYVVTAIDEYGETVASNEVTGTTTATDLTLMLDWADITGATGYRVYRTAAAGASGSETLLATTTTSTYTDDGSVAPGAGVPPTENTAVYYPTKTFGNSEWIDGVRFINYAGQVCKAVGRSSGTEAALQRAYLANESRGVERAVMTSLFAGATDVTPAGGAVDVRTALALLEGDAATKYAGAPVIHVPRSIGSQMFYDRAAVRDGNAYATASGLKLASGAGYQAFNIGPDGNAPAAGELWMYASGEVSLARGELMSNEQLDRSTNDFFVLVERMYVASVDCYVSAVKVSI